MIRLLSTIYNSRSRVVRSAGMVERPWRGRIGRWPAITGGILLLAVVAAAWRIGYMAAPHETGYFAPGFAPDGQSVFTIAREVRAAISGFGAEFFTPPATVRMLSDRFRLIQIRVPDGRVTTVEDLPP